MARWRNIGGEAARSVGFWLVVGLITYLGMSAVIKIEATGTRLFLAIVVFGVAFGAAYLLEHLLRAVPNAIRPNGELHEGWPRWYSHLSEPTVYRLPGDAPYSYVVLPRPMTTGGQAA